MLVRKACGVASVQVGVWLPARDSARLFISEGGDRKKVRGGNLPGLRYVDGVRALRRKLAFAMLLLVGLMGPLQSLARACCAAPVAQPTCCCPTQNSTTSNGESDVLRRACCRLKSADAAPAFVEVLAPAPDPLVAPPAALPSPLTANWSVRAVVPSPPPDPRPPDHPLWLSLRTLRC